MVFKEDDSSRLSAEFTTEVKFRSKRYEDFCRLIGQVQQANFIAMDQIAGLIYKKRYRQDIKSLRDLRKFIDDVIREIKKKL